MSQNKNIPLKILWILTWKIKSTRKGIGHLSDQFLWLWEDLWRKDNKKLINTKKLAIATSVFKKKQTMVHKPIVLKQASKKWELTNWDNIFIPKTKISFKILKSHQQIKVLPKSCRRQHFGCYKNSITTEVLDWKWRQDVFENIPEKLE